jgi:hypothetical protein
MQYSEYFTSAAANPGLMVYFILGIRSFHCSWCSARGKRRWTNRVVLYHCFMLAAENVLSSTMAKWVKNWWRKNPNTGGLMLRWRPCADSAKAISGQWALGAPLLNGEEIVRRENDVVKANVEFRRSRVADNVSKVFDARIGDANRGDFP